MDVTNDYNRIARFGWRRLIGIPFGLGTHLLFGFTVWHLFFFLRDGGTPSSGSAGLTLMTDGLLALQFAVIHSTLLYPTVRRKLQRWISPAFYGCFFCVTTCLTLLTTIRYWHAGTDLYWEVHGWTATAIRAGFYASWASLFYSLWLSGMGYQTGWTPWWHWFRRLPPPRREFQERGAYRLIRHPIYLSFLGLIWFTPQITFDRLLLMGLWTAYIAVGSYLKDERLAYFLGRTYREYQERVPGFPLIGPGLLGRRPRVPVESEVPAEVPDAPRKAA